MIFKTSVILFSALLLVSCNQKPDKKAITQKPNILFILADDLGYHDLSCMGSDYYETPNIDNIARDGMVFTDGYAACQVCSPSRASIMSGKFPARHGITDWIGAKTGEAWREAGRFNKLLPPENKDHLESDYITLAEAMKAEGYTTFFAGKWHLGGEGSLPGDHGFDTNKGGWDKGSPMGGFYAPWDNPYLENGPDGESLTMRLATETANFIRGQNDKPFFAFLSFYAVHAPIQTTKDKWTKYRNKAEEIGIAERGFEMGRFLPIRQVQDNPVYGGLVETMDDAVGIVMNTLEELGLDKNTIVIFTSDNGGVSAGDNFATSNLPLRGGKGYQYEGGILEPYFIKAPWLDNAGKQSDVPVTGTDFYPTLLELIGADLKPEEHSDGVSLVPLLTGGTLEERPLFWHYPHYGNQGGEPSSIIRLGEWKLIHYYEDGREELFNLEKDVEESNNVADENAEMVDNLSEQLFGYLNKVGALFPEKDPTYDAELEQQYLDRVENVFLPELEKQRMEYLSKDFDPGNKWWGSEVDNP